MREVIRKRYKKFKRWLMGKIAPDDWKEYKYNRAVFDCEPYDIKRVSTQIILNDKSYHYLHSADGKGKYDYRYGMARTLGESLKDYLVCTDSYNEGTDEWTCRAEIYIAVKRKERKSW